MNKYLILVFFLFFSCNGRYYIEQKLSLDKTKIESQAKRIKYYRTMILYERVIILGRQYDGIEMADKYKIEYKECRLFIKRYRKNIRDVRR